MRNGGKVYFQCHVYDLNTEPDLKAKRCRLTFAVLVCEGNNVIHATEKARRGKRRSRSKSPDFRHKEQTEGERRFLVVFWSYFGPFLVVL